MLISARRGISYPNPDRSDRPDIPAHILNLINALEIDAIYVQGTDATRIARAHMAGVFFWTTDTAHLWYDDGVAWHQIDSNPASGNQIGTFAARPAANAVSAGTVYFATDTLGQWRSDGVATWTLIDQGIPLIAPASLSTLAGPYDGQLVALQVDATNGVNWTFRYNAGSASAFKWESVGAPAALAAVVDTSESTTSTTYAALTTAGPAVTFPRNGDYDVGVGCRSTSATGGSLNVMSFDIGATGAVDADAAVGGANMGAAPLNGGAWLERRKTGMTSGTVLTAKYKTAAGQTASFASRILRITPIRIS